MDFNIKKLAHIFAFLMITISIFVMIILPVISFFNVPSTTQSTEVENFPKDAKVVFQIFLLFIQLAIVLVVLVIFPVIWYLIVNQYNFKDIITCLKLRLKGLDEAFIWAVITVVFMFVISFIIGILATSSGVKSDDQGNIQDLETYFNPALLFILLAVQPTAEEIFFRGFLLDKIRSFGGDYAGIILTGILFGLAHMSYGKIYPVIFITLMGFVLAFIVIKTKSLYSAILAHTAFNLISFILYLFAKSLI